MARIRTIKPEFFTSLTIASLSVHARLTFIGMWTHADDEGRCVADARLVKAAVWPLDDRTAADVERDLDELTEASLITQYEVAGRWYYAITNWSEHQKINRPTRSKLPAPTAPGAIVLTSSNGLLPGMSLSTHAQLTEDSRPEQGTGNREQGTGKGTLAHSANRADKPRGVSDDDPQFAAFWKAYPRRADKGHARKAWTAAIKKADPDAIVAAAEKFAAVCERDRTEPRFIAMPATWLNGERWTDEQPRRLAAVVNGNRHQPYRDPTDMSVYTEGL